MTPQDMEAVLAEHSHFEHAFDFDGTMRTMTTDCWHRHVTLDLHVVGADAVRPYYEQLFTAFPDFGGSTDGKAFAPGVRASWGELHGTMRGPWLGFRPTLRSFALPFFAKLEFRDGLLVSEMLHYDSADFCGQLELPRAELKRACRIASNAPTGAKHTCNSTERT